MPQLWHPFRVHGVMARFLGRCPRLSCPTPFGVKTVSLHTAQALDALGKQLGAIQTFQ
jgi:hypothetical protein